eukprot:gene7724-1383_t
MSSSNQTRSSGVTVGGEICGSPRTPCQTPHKRYQVESAQDEMKTKAGPCASQNVPPGSAATHEPETPPTPTEIPCLLTPAESVDHVLRNMELFPLACPICARFFATKQAVIDHCKADHGSKDPVSGWLRKGDGSPGTYAEAVSSSSEDPIVNAGLVYCCDGANLPAECEEDVKSSPGKRSHCISCCQLHNVMNLTDLVPADVPQVESYTCKFCSYCTTRKRQLRRHLSTFIHKKGISQTSVAESLALPASTVSRLLSEQTKSTSESTVDKIRGFVCLHDKAGKGSFSQAFLALKGYATHMRHGCPSLREDHQEDTEHLDGTTGNADKPEQQQPTILDNATAICVAKGHSMVGASLVLSAMPQKEMMAGLMKASLQALPTATHATVGHSMVFDTPQGISCHKRACRPSPATPVSGKASAEKVCADTTQHLHPSHQDGQTVRSPGDTSKACKKHPAQDASTNEDPANTRPNLSPDSAQTGSVQTFFASRKRLLTNHAAPSPKFLRLSASLCRMCSQGSTEGSMLLCDMCCGAYHLACLEPAVSQNPEDDWYCADGCRNIHLNMIKKASMKDQQATLSLSQMQHCEAILSQLMQLDADHDYFTHPVDTNLAPGYLDVVKQPISLIAIKRNLVSYRAYLSDNVSDFGRDVLMVYQNALVFNKPGTFLHSHASRMFALAKELLNSNKSLHLVPNPTDDTMGARRQGQADCDDDGDE